MHLTVGVGPPGSALPSEIDVGLPLVKAALLYGDRVTLCSPAASVLVRLRDDQPTALADRLAVLAGLAHDLDLDDRPARLAEVLGAGRVDADHARATVDGWWRRYRQALAQAVAESGLAELAPAVAAGRLTIETLGIGPVVHPTDFAQTAAETYAGVVSQAVACSDATPLLDAETARGVGRAVAAGRVDVSPARSARARNGGLAAHTLQRLPLFEKATVAEVLDVRADLDGPLVRFRAAITDFADEVAGAVWDADFPVEAARVYDQRVAPAVADVEDAVASVGYLRELVSRYAERPGQFVPVTAPLLTVALTSADALSQTVAATLSGLSLAANAAQAWHASRDARREVQARRLFFVYAAGRRLAGRAVW